MSLAARQRFRFWTTTGHGCSRRRCAVYQMVHLV